MASVVLWSAGLVAVLLSGHRLYRARRHLTPGVLYLCSAVSCVGVSAALAAPGTLTATLRLEPFPGATRLVANGFAMASAFCVHGLLINLVSERDRARRAVRRQLVLLVVAFAVLAGLLVAAPIRSTSDFVARYAREPAVVGYVLLFCAYIAWSLGNFVRLIQHHRRYSDRPLMRVGLAIAQVGTAVGTVWAVWKSVAALVVLATGRRLTVEGPVSAVLSAACVALIAVGVTLPTWFPLLARPVGWLRARRAHRALEPLWRALREAMPRISTPEADGDAHWRLARRLVEIRDGLLLLAPYRDPALDAELRTASADPAVVEAARVAAALSAHRRGAPPRPDPPEPPAVQAADVASETAWLRRVARAYHRSPVVARYRRAGKESRA